MKRLIFTLCAAAIALAVMGFAFVALTDAPVAQHEIVKDLSPSSATGSAP